MVAVALGLSACGGAGIEHVRERDLAEAAAALETNLAAIHHRDAEAYLAHYLDSPELAIVSQDSVARGFLVFAEARRASPEWPDTLITGRRHFLWVAPGVVWAAFPFTLVGRGDTTYGVSERLFLKTGQGWKIVVTGSYER